MNYNSINNENSNFGSFNSFEKRLDKKNENSDLKNKMVRILKNSWELNKVIIEQEIGVQPRPQLIIENTNIRDKASVIDKGFSQEEIGQLIKYISLKDMENFKELIK